MTSWSITFDILETILQQYVFFNFRLVKHFIIPPCMMDWRTLDKVSIPYENAHCFSLYSDRPHQVPSCHQVVGDFTTFLRSPGDFTKIQCLGLFQFCHIGLWPVVGWRLSSQSALTTKLHDNALVPCRIPQSLSESLQNDYHPSFTTPIHNVDRRNPTPVDMDIISYHRVS